MEQEIFPKDPESPQTPANPPSFHKARPEVVTVRNFREYFGESLLIVFSVVLALILTELINRANERKQIREILGDIRNELQHNAEVARNQYEYHLGILQRIDSALKSPVMQAQLLSNGQFNLESLVPHGILLGGNRLVETAWEVARSKNIAAHLDMPTLTLLTTIYHDQEEIVKVEEEIGKILLSYDSRKPENLRTTLILMRDNFSGWSTGRTPGLLVRYRQALDRLAEIQ